MWGGGGIAYKLKPNCCCGQLKHNYFHLLSITPHSQHNPIPLRFEWQKNKNSSLFNTKASTGCDVAKGLRIRNFHVDEFSINFWNLSRKNKTCFKMQTSSSSAELNREQIMCLSIEGNNYTPWASQALAQGVGYSALGCCPFAFIG